MALEGKKNIFDDKRSRAKREGTNSYTVSASVMRRMPRYFRFLRDLLNNDILRISSGDLAKLMGITPSQVRQDFNCFGDFGQQGYGYNVKFLYTQVSRILCVNKKYSAVMIGAGDITKSLLSSNIFDIRGIRVKGVFSYNENEVGTKCGDFTVLSADALKGFCAGGISIAVLALPEFDGDICDTLADCGIKGVWNFSTKELSSNKIKCQNVMLGDTLMLLMNEIKDNEISGNGENKDGN